MPFYQRLGDVPRKRHVQFRDNGTLLTEEVMGLEGFAGNESILYHLTSPCRVEKLGDFEEIERKEWIPKEHKPLHLKTWDFDSGGDALSGRKLLMWNDDVEISLCRPTEEMEGFFRNGEGDEVIFVHIHPPSELDTHRERGEFYVKVRVRGGYQTYVLDYHPFDVVGWDGYVYPWTFSIHDFEPITGRIHMPPPSHQTFQGRNFVICSFCPRKLDFDPQAIPIPYHHSNLNSEEMIYYVDGNFASRKAIEIGSVTLHPSGIPHGPAPGLAEKSIGMTETHELAVMCDTFHPLRLTKLAKDLDDGKYWHSWFEDPVPVGTADEDPAGVTSHF